MRSSVIVPQHIASILRDDVILEHDTIPFMGMAFSKDAHFLLPLRSPHGVSPNLGSKAMAAPFENSPGMVEDLKIWWDVGFKL